MPLLASVLFTCFRQTGFDGLFGVAVTAGQLVVLSNPNRRFNSAISASSCAILVRSALSETLSR